MWTSHSSSLLATLVRCSRVKVIGIRERRRGVLPPFSMNERSRKNGMQCRRVFYAGMLIYGVRIGGGCKLGSSKLFSYNTSASNCMNWSAPLGAYLICNIELAKSCRVGQLDNSFILPLSAPRPRIRSHRLLATLTNAESLHHNASHSNSH